MDSVIHSFHIKVLENSEIRAHADQRTASCLQGKKNYSIYLPAPVTNVAPLSLRKTRIVNALLVALENGTVRLYNNKHLVSLFAVASVPALGND